MNPSILDALNIACVVNVAPELPDTPLHSDDIIYHKINILDNSNERILLHFDEAADLIQKVSARFLFKWYNAVIYKYYDIMIHNNSSSIFESDQEFEKFFSHLLE